jgi:AraC family transcriptional regulator, transcriptional activator of pobA
VKEGNINEHLNSLNGRIDFEVFPLKPNSLFETDHKDNYYTIMIIGRGNGKVKLDFSEFTFEEKSILFFSISQSFRIINAGNIEGFAMRFHPDFFSFKEIQAEIPEDVLLFSSCYTPSTLKLNDDEEFSLFLMVIDDLKEALQSDGSYKIERIISDLRIFILEASKLKSIKNQEALTSFQDIKIPFKSQYLVDAIENNFKTKHNVEFYTDFFQIPLNILNQICFEKFRKSLIDLIFERIIIECNRQLYITTKTLKQISVELGFKDEDSFKEVFESRTGLSPELFRETLGYL